MTKKKISVTSAMKNEKWTVEKEKERRQRRAIVQNKNKKKVTKKERFPNTST